MPEAFVATVIVAVLLLKTPDAPAPGAVKVTFTPLTGLFPASFTVTAIALLKAVLTVADCGVVPAFAVIEVAPATACLMFTAAWIIATVFEVQLIVTEAAPGAILVP